VRERVGEIERSVCRERQTKRNRQTKETGIEPKR